MDHFNKLTPKEAELLAMLAEEAAEVIQVVGKIQRHGFNSCHPDDPLTDNRDLLVGEITDFQAVHNMLTKAKLLPIIRPNDIKRAERRKLNYAHHQG